jgi:hypothetical protein
VYVYFLACLVLPFFSFGFSAMRLDEKQFINSPSSLAFYVSLMSLMMMLVTSSIMGVPLYRDIEYNTKEYYLSYPITKSGYFWGRYLSSFLFVLIIDSAVLIGAYLGSKAGPAFGWMPASHYGPNLFINYIYPYLTLAVPNLFFTSSLFFGLVAITRNVKVIYSAGILLFLGYLIANFFIGTSSNQSLIYLSDPFAVNAVRAETNLQTVTEKNTLLTAMHGLLLLNRVLWLGVGAVILAYTYISFNFETFFSGRKDKKESKRKTEPKYALPTLNISFKNGYARNTLFTLTKIEIINIIRDNYFWIIIAGGSIFLGIVFSHGPGNYWVRDLPRTSVLLYIFNNNFLLFIFCIIIFYTGEAVHRERSTRYAFINDALPPSDLILNLSKFLGILALALFLTLLPMVIGIVMQLSLGYTWLNIPLYLSTLLGVTLPGTVEMGMFAFALHILINNKFAAMGAGVAIWVLVMLADESRWMDYHLLLYYHTPYYGITDFEGIGHMWKPLAWFNIYWLLAGSLLALLGYLFYVRGTISAFKERVQVAKERFTLRTRIIAGLLAVFFVVVLAFNYYNVSYLNTYYSGQETQEHNALTEKQLKHYEDMPLPQMTNLKVYADIYPDDQEVVFKSLLTLVNNTKQPITELLLDGDNISAYSLKYNGSDIAYTCPLFFKRGKFNFLKPAWDSSAYRLYKLPSPLAPGSTATAEVNAVKEYAGFRNGFYGPDILGNGTAVGMGLPDFGYDDDDEITYEEYRKKYGLPKKSAEFPADEDSAGAWYLLPGKNAGQPSFDITISTVGDQTAVAPGNLIKQWTANGRNYYEYAYNKQGIVTGLGIASARYALLKDSVRLNNGRLTSVEIYYNPQHNTNLQRFASAYKDGLAYFTSAWGPYPFNGIRLVESSEYMPNLVSGAALDKFSERFGWNADFTDPNQWDYCYFITAQQLAKEWWGKQVVPSHTRGAGIITEGLPKYAALVMMEKKYGPNNINNIISEELDGYIWQRGRTIKDQQPLLHTTRGNEENNKTGLVLLGLEHLIGEDSVNAALREFYNAFAFKTSPPFAGSKDLYYYLKKHVPDSLQYYLADTWEKVTFYNNRVVSATATPLKNNQYKVTIKISTDKTYEDSDGNEQPAKNMNDYIDIGIFAADTPNKQGRLQVNPLYLRKHKYTAGEHTIEMIVTGKPASVAIDPFLRLIDRVPGDNVKTL